MADFLMDRRDLEFLLYEQFDLTKQTSWPRYAEMSKETFDDVLTQNFEMCKKVLAPTNVLSDREGCRLEGGQVKIPKAIHEAYGTFAESGWVAMSQSPEYGGMGLPFPLTIAATEAQIASSSSFMFYPGLTVSAAHLLEKFAPAWLRDVLVPKMYTGKWTGTMCLTEPHAGSAVGDILTSATPVEGTQEYMIKGNKTFISAGDHDLTANVIHLVLARIQGDPLGIKGISLFAVPKNRFDGKGKITGPNDVACTAIEHKMGINGSATCSLSFGDNEACQGYLVGERCKGIVAMFQMMNEARIICGLQGVALGNYAYQLALAYAKDRTQGTSAQNFKDPYAPRVKIVEHPDVRRNLMIAKAYSEGIRALLMQASFYADTAHNSDDPEARTQNRDLLDLMTPICKAYATDKGFKVTELAIQIHGGYGYIKEYGVEQCMRDSKIASLYEGTNGIQAIDLLARKMQQKGGGLFMGWLQKVNDFVAAYGEDKRFKDDVAALDKAKNALADVAFHFMSQGAEDMEGVLLGATPFLEMFGHVEVARLLLEQSVIATSKLEAIFKAREISTQDAKKKLLVEDADARFYDGKIKTAKFFLCHILPETASLAQSIKSADRSALEIQF